MTDEPRTLFERVVLPVASEADAETTCAAAAAHVRAADGRAVVVHVIEKAGGAPDKASVEQRETRAEDIFAAARRSFDEETRVETRLVYATDVAQAIRDVADDLDATAIAFTPRDGSRWIKLLTGDVAHALVTEADRPVVVLPDAEGG